MPRQNVVNGMSELYDTQNHYSLKNFDNSRHHEALTLHMSEYSWCISFKKSVYRCTWISIDVISMFVSMKTSISSFVSARRHMCEWWQNFGVAMAVGTELENNPFRMERDFPAYIKSITIVLDFSHLQIRELDYLASSYEWKTQFIHLRAPTQTRFLLLHLRIRGHNKRRQTCFDN